MKNTSAYWIYLAAAIAACGALIHLGAMAGGAEWDAFFNAPPAVVASARAGTWLAPASAAAIALLMAICGAYACSAAGLLRRLPLLRTALASIAALCLLRALILVPLAVNHSELRNVFEVVAAIVWGLAGIGFTTAFVNVQRSSRQPRSVGTRAHG